MQADARTSAAAIDAKLRKWVADCGFEAALPLKFVLASDVLEAAKTGTSISDAADSWLVAALLRALSEVCNGRVVRAKAPHARSTGNTAIFWGVTCEALPAAPLVVPQWCPKEERPMKDKKAAKIARRRARGMPEPDPRQCRIVSQEKGSHFAQYTDELLGLKSAAQMLELRLFPSAKELTESFACFNAAREHLSSVFRPDDPSVLAVVVGDGLTPRTAALFCFRTKWRCVSIDPLMREDQPWSTRIERLTAVRAKLQDAAAGESYAAERVLLILPHAHIGLDECMKYVDWQDALGAIVMPCCNWYMSAQRCGPPFHEADDFGIISPHRLMRVWKWLRSDTLPPAVPPPSDRSTREEEHGVHATDSAGVDASPCLSACAECEPTRANDRA